MPNISITTRDVARELARRYSTMTHEELDMLESILVPMKFAKNEFILREGEISTNIFWIVKGLVRQFYFKNDKELTEYMATENNIVMCIESLFREQPTKLQIKALEPTILIALPKADLEAVAMKSVNIQILYRKILEESLILSQHHADMLRFDADDTRDAFSCPHRYAVGRLVPLQKQGVINAKRQFLLVVSHVDQRHGWILAVFIHQVFYHFPIQIIQTMQGLVENQQIRFFDEPFPALFLLSFRGSYIEPHRVFQSAGNNLKGWDILFVTAMHLGRHVADMALDVPDALTRTALMSKE